MIWRKIINTLIFIALLKSIYAQPDNEFVFIKGGKFYMGSPDSIGQYDEHPRHKVKIRSFYVSKYEITNKQFCEFLNQKGNRHEGNTLWIDLNGKWRNEKCRIYQKADSFYVEKGYEDYPVLFVSWWGARAYCKWRGGHLPTEAQWEYLAKTGFTNTMLKDSLSYYAVFYDNSGAKPNKVGTKLPDKNGLYDLFGNMSEWCTDWYSDTYYYVSPKRNPQGPLTGRMKVKRGGNWFSKKSVLYPTNRKASNPDLNNITIGFRCVIEKNNFKKK